jgi:hypothetical protein
MTKIEPPTARTELMRAVGLARRRVALSSRVEAVVASILAYRKSKSIGSKKKTRQLIAEALGYSEKRLRQAEEIVIAAERFPERYAHLVLEMDRTGNVNRSFIRLNALAATQRIFRAPDAKPKI